MCAVTVSTVRPVASVGGSCAENCPAGRVDPGGGRLSAAGSLTARMDTPDSGRPNSDAKTGSSAGTTTSGRKWNFRLFVARSYSIMPFPGSFTARSSHSSPHTLGLVYSMEPA